MNQAEQTELRQQAEVREAVGAEEEEEKVNEDLVARRDMSKHGEGDKYVGDDLRDREAERTDETEGRYNYKQGGSNIREEEDEGGWFNHKQQGSSIASTIEPEQVQESHIHLPI